LRSDDGLIRQLFSDRAQCDRPWKHLGIPHLVQLLPSQIQERIVVTLFELLDTPPVEIKAGIVGQGDGLPSSSSLHAIERTFRVNFLGTVAVTQAMPPSLRKASSATIVNVSSALGSLTKSGDPAWTHVAGRYLGYAASKAALNMLTMHLTWEVRGTSIRVNSVYPGYTATDLNEHLGTQFVPEGAAEIIRRGPAP
jgi:NAD(P)-dependent dehydrogenase (short-subunit alcohol dehydrogenase family)